MYNLKGEQAVHHYLKCARDKLSWALSSIVLTLSNMHHSLRRHWYHLGILVKIFSFLYDTAFQMFCELGNQMHETIQQFSVKGNKCIFTNEWCNQTKLKSSLRFLTFRLQLITTKSHTHESSLQLYTNLILFTFISSIHSIYLLLVKVLDNPSLHFE